MTTEKSRQSAKETETKENIPSPPDGGWGWVIVFAVFTGNCLMDGCVGSYGIFYPELLRAFESGPVITSMAGSLLPAVHMMSSPLVGRINTKYGSRPVCFVGGCIGGLGLILASLSYNMAMFMIGFGVILGIGISMNFLPGHVITNNYFDKKRGIAGGIVCSGAGFGIFILAPVLQLLLEEYGWRGTMLITAGIFMQLCACSTLLRPLCTRKKISDKVLKESDKTESNEYVLMISNDVDECHTLKDTEVKSDIIHLKCFEYHTQTQLKTDIEENLDCFEQSQHHPLRRITMRDRCASDDTLAVKHKLARQDLGIKYTIKSLQDIPSDKYTIKMEEFLRNSQFIHPVVALAQSQQFSDEIDSCIVSEHGSEQVIRKTSLLCKTTPCDMSILRNKTFIPILLGGVLIQMGQFIPNMFIPEYCFSIGLDGTQMSVIMAIYGYFPPLQIMVIVECLGIDKLTSSLGLLQMAKGPAALFGPPLAGLVYQYSQNYAMSLGFAGILFLLAAGIQSIVPLANICCKDRETKTLNTDVEILVS
ncbi:monocarboxylate transporter 13-like isoform X2 [Mercenaria mercenaria]|uniref:monocarboxylate transporter 13-like isoform X2 n=1 Tax=Mercenaria mercenaria TaxID=6596 RepID=UPI00234EB5E2|nr:monocarboxylate transporter 13-like isoform X2 [Mercenaria mercenaria]